MCCNVLCGVGYLNSGHGIQPNLCGEDLADLRGNHLLFIIKGIVYEQDAILVALSS